MSLHPEKIEELRLELLSEEQCEPMNAWIEDNKANLEIRYLKEIIPIEDHPLDDDYPSFFDEHYDEFRLFADKIYEEEQ